MMSLALGLQILETAAVVIGVVFGLIQLKQLRHQRETAAGMELLHSLREMGSASLLLYDLQDDLTGEELRAELGDDFRGVFDFLCVFESLGPLVARGQVPVEMHADFYRGATIVSWSKVRRYVIEKRQLGWSTFFEWLQWLAEQMEKRTPLVESAPAFDRLQAWQKKEDFDRLSKNRLPEGITPGDPG